MGTDVKSLHRVTLLVVLAVLPCSPFVGGGGYAVVTT